VAFRFSDPLAPSQFTAVPAANVVKAFDHCPPLITVPVVESPPDTVRSCALIDAPSTAPAFWAARAIKYTASYVCEAYNWGAWLKYRALYRVTKSLYNEDTGAAGAVPHSFVTSTPTDVSWSWSTKTWS